MSEDLYSIDKWQKVNAHQESGHLANLNAMFRLKVPGGWLIAMGSPLSHSPSALTYYPDREHSWLSTQKDNDGNTDQI